MASSGLLGRVPGTNLVYRNVCDQNIYTHKMKFKNQKASQVWQPASIILVLGTESGGPGWGICWPRGRLRVKATMQDIEVQGRVSLLTEKLGEEEVQDKAQRPSSK